jgi:hypothetical protein
VFTTNRTFPFNDGYVQTEEIIMQAVKTELFGDVDFHNENLVVELHNLLRSECLTAFEITYLAAEIVAKRKQPEVGFLDPRTGLRY